MDRTVNPVPGLRGTVITPPDKSIAQRAALFALLTVNETVIRNYPLAQDPQSALKCVRVLGADVYQNEGVVRISGPGRQGFPAEAGTIDCGNSGTVMRLLAGILAGAGTGATLTGDESLSRRTMKRIIDPLRSMGAVIEARDDTRAPIRLQAGPVLSGIHFRLPVASAQLKSCVLLAGLFTGETSVTEDIPSRNHTENMLNLRIEKNGDSNRIFSSVEHPVPDISITIPGDFSSAAFWLVAGSIYPDSDILIAKTGLNPTRSAALDVLQRMGADIRIEGSHIIEAGYNEGPEPMADIRVRTAELTATGIEPSEIPNCIDEIPVLAVAMAFANGTSSIRGAAELRHKECDRIDAIARVLSSAGVRVKEFEDGLEITGNPGFIPVPSTFDSRHDHRIAMSSAILAGLASGPSTIRHAEAAGVSYSGFWDDFDKLAVRI